MRDVSDAQSPAGGFPNVAPRIVDQNDAAPAWGDAGVIVPWTLYRHYGDTRILEQNWEAMTRWMAYIAEANGDGIWRHLDSWDRHPGGLDRPRDRRCGPGSKVRRG